MTHEPPPSVWEFPPVDMADAHGLLAIGADLEPGTLLEAYRSGIFPMPVDDRDSIGWWSPDPRGVLDPAGVVISKSLRRSLRRYDVRIDTAFDTVMAHCGDPRRPHGWITDQFRLAYGRLHELGWAHSVETWDGPELVGGLYGIGIGAFFAGESMFHHATDASKVALVALCQLLAHVDTALVDVQWLTPHLTSLGAVEVSRTTYLVRLGAALATPGPTWA